MNNKTGPLRLFIYTTLAAALILLPSCADEEPYVKETFVMGTAAWVTIHGLNESAAAEAAEEALRELHRIESIMSSWKKDSELSRLNRESDGKPYDVSRELYHLFERSIYYSHLTAGAFDITARPLVQLWGFQGGKAHLPDSQEIEDTMSRVGYGKVMLDGESTSIIMPPGMELDLAGIAKGYGVDRAVAILRERDVESALVNLGGNIYALGTPPGERGWTVGIRDPEGGRKVVGSLLLADEAVSTSGNYENYVEIDGTVYGHIIDPRAGRPVSHILSVTVIAQTALEADALSTGLFVLGPESGEKALELLPEVGAIFALPNGEGIIYRTVGEFGERLTLEESDSR
jgi:thiamine biosynthesis lipoprotein